MADSYEDPNTIAYRGIFRIYRNAVVAYIRRRLQEAFGNDWEAAVRKPFQKEWDQLVKNAQTARTPVDAVVSDAADYLSVNHFYNMFDTYYKLLWPEGDQDAKAALLHWAKSIKLVRDVVAHPSELNLSFSDCFVLLDAARRILIRIDQTAADSLDELQTALLAETSTPALPLARYLPPRENVVLDFVGRREILADLHRWFLDPLTRRWLLCADGGRGKSAIAYEFAEQISRHEPEAYALVAWLSAKERHYQAGEVVALAPDFVDLESAIDKLLFAYGADSTGDLSTKTSILLQQLDDLPALIVVDDVDSLTGQGEQSIEFFALRVPTTKSKVLFTSRRVPLGLGATVTHVDSFTGSEARAFVESRVRLYQLERSRFGPQSIDDILQLTDSSPLYIDDLMRLCKNLSPTEAMRAWQMNRGKKVRQYALQREIELLTPLARKVLMACALSSSPMSLAELEIVVNVSNDEAVDALTELGNFYLIPQPRVIDEQPRYALNSNTQRLVQEVYGRSSEGRAIAAAIGHVFGQGSAPETERDAVSICRHAVVLVTADRAREAEAVLLDGLSAVFPNHPRLIGQLGWVYKRWKPPRRVDARSQFDRAYQLHNAIPEMYWHWADMEAQVEDWQSSLAASKKGIERCGNEPRLLLLAGEATNRMAYRLNQLHESRAQEEHERALAWFVGALEASKRIRADADEISRIYGGIARVARVLGRKEPREKYLQQWANELPNDPSLRREQSRVVS